MFGFDADLVSKIDLEKADNDKKFRELVESDVWCFDEVSMVDVDGWDAILRMAQLVEERRNKDRTAEIIPFGSKSVLLFGDFKQLPPATSKPPFIVQSWVPDAFSFRVLRQNRRIIGDAGRQQELDNFHGVLHDISYGICSARVEDFVVDCYVRGAAASTAQDHH